MADKPDQRPDDMTPDPDTSELPFYLWPLHVRLVADGECWRWRSPDGRNLSTWARAMLTASPSAPDSANDGLRERRLDAHDEHLSRPKGPSPRMDSPHTSTSTRWRAVAGALAAAVVVGSLATLLIRNAANHGAGATGNATSSIPPTPGLTVTPNPSQSASLQPGDLPVVAPSNPQIVYRVVKKAPQRSTDGGKTYSALSMPNTDITPIGDVWIAVSPLDPARVFLTVSGLKNGQGCLPPAASNGPQASHGGTLFSGYTDCSEQFYSANSGQSWAQLHLPGGDVMGSTDSFRIVERPVQSPAYVLQAQGTRLYASAGFAAQGGSILASYGARLLTSVDGGATWSLIDQPINGAGLFTCDFAASPMGSTVYAAVTNQSCGNEGMPAMSLWRSDNAGQSWSKVSNLPSPVEGGMAVSNSGALYIFEPAGQAQSHSASISMTPQYALVSLNKSVSFTGAPSAGLPKDATLVGPFGVLSDGSVIYWARTGGDQTTGEAGLYMWKAGAASWELVTSSLTGAPSAVFVTPLAGGGDTLTFTDMAGDITTVKVSR
jgi:hypothetical protein